jgi:hypothetical protein
MKQYIVTGLIAEFAGLLCLFVYLWLAPSPPHGTMDDVMDRFVSPVFTSRHPYTNQDFGSKILLLHNAGNLLERASECENTCFLFIFCFPSLALIVLAIKRRMRNSLD